MPATRVTRDSICGSVTPRRAQDRASRLPARRARQRSRARARAARRAAAMQRGVAVGRQARGASSAHASPPRALPSRTIEPAASGGCQRARPASNSRITVDPMLKRPSSAPFVEDRVAGAGMWVDDAPRGGRDVAGPDGGDAAHVERADQHHRELPEVALEQRQHPLVARKQPRHAPCRGRRSR